MTKTEKENLINSLIQRKEVFDVLGIKIMADADFDIAQRMIPYIPTINPITNPVGRIISKDEALSRSYKYLNLFGKSYADRVSNKLDNIEIKEVFEYTFCFTTNVTYKLDEETKKINKDSGNIDHLKTPIIFDEVSPMWLAHEHIHNLKELYYDEYSEGQVLGDVIPMFFELLIADQESSEKEKVYIKNRLFLLKNEINGLEYAKSILSDQKDLYKVFATSAMQYINSYYYSLRLYDLYESGNEEVVTKIKEVLDGEKTTKSILKELGLLYNYSERKTRKGIQKVLNRIK